MFKLESLVGLSFYTQFIFIYLSELTLFTYAHTFLHTYTALKCEIFFIFVLLVKVRDIY